jgi:hypothetical protein
MYVHTSVSYQNQPESAPQLRILLQNRTNCSEVFWRNCGENLQKIQIPSFNLLSPVVLSHKEMERGVLLACFIQWHPNRAIALPHVCSCLKEIKQRNE